MTNLQNLLDNAKFLDNDGLGNSTINATAPGLMDELPAIFLNPFAQLMVKLLIYFAVRVWGQFRRERERREEIRQLMQFDRRPIPMIRHAHRPAHSLSRDARLVRGNPVYRNRTRHH